MVKGLHFQIRNVLADVEVAEVVTHPEWHCPFKQVLNKVLLQGMNFAVSVEPEIVGRLK
ncbi:MAG: hypothetical protein GY731_14120 [Gammaproteobacteria bacterium]|nr:hypothetical protein [Gammaproteobacteria bacterium]